MKKTLSTLLVTCIMIIKLSHYIMLPKANAQVKSYDAQTEQIYFLIEDDDSLEKCNTVWDTISADIEKKLIASLSIIKII